MKRKMICLLLALALSGAMITGCSPAPQTGPSNETQGGSTEPSVPPVTAPEDEPYIEPPTAPPVEVKLPSYEMSYSGDMAELISWEEKDEGLCFYVQIAREKHPIFTVVFGQTTGDFVEAKVNAQGEQVWVSFVMEPIPEDLSGESRVTFETAQDLVNDINASLVVK